MRSPAPAAAAAVALAAAALLALSGCARSPSASLLASGLAAARTDAWDDAVREWTRAVEREPGSAAAHNNLAVACERRGDWDEAAREYETARRLAPDDAAIRTNHEAFKARLERLRGKAA
jgi:Flp pilus assembly protein TadD